MKERKQQLRKERRERKRERKKESERERMGELQDSYTIQSIKMQIMVHTQFCLGLTAAAYR